MEQLQSIIQGISFLISSPIRREVNKVVDYLAKEGVSSLARCLYYGQFWSSSRHLFPVYVVYNIIEKVLQKKNKVSL